MNTPTHDDLIVDQFTRQAIPFNTARALNDARALETVVRACAPESDDTALDVACGGGIVACALAPHVRRVTGVDMTPAMLERAAALASERSIGNATWLRADVISLPFPDATFSIVATRFSIHHFVDPERVLREMMRLCRPGGRIVVVDMYASETAVEAAAWNRLERLRDPSHVRVLPLTELRSLFARTGLPAPTEAFYEIRDTVDNLLARSFPNPGDEPAIRAMFRASAADGSLGIETTLVDGELRYAYPTAVLSTLRPPAPSV